LTLKAFDNEKSYAKKELIQKYTY